MKYPNGSESTFFPGPWQQLKAIRSCICADGKARYAEITGQPTTYFSIPARVKVRGKWITGYVTMARDYLPNVKEGYEFLAYSYGKNYHLLPNKER